MVRGDSPENHVTEISDIGLIKRLALPEGWVATRQLFGQFGNSFVYNYGREDESDMQLSILYRGMLVSSLSGKTFERILKKEPHQLNSEAILSLTEVLGGCGQPDLYDLDGASTITLADRNVVDVSGRFPEVGLENRTIFIDGGSDGCEVLEITFSAPKQLFSKHAPALDTCFHSIEWK